MASLATESFRIPAHDYRYVPARIGTWPATLIVSIKVANGDPITIELLTKAQLEEFARGRSPEVLFRVDRRLSAEWQRALPGKGEYDIVLANDSDRPTDVRFEASVEFAPEPDVARYLSPMRRLMVIAISLFVFVITIAWSAYQLMGAMQPARLGHRS